MKRVYFLLPFLLCWQSALAQDNVTVLEDSINSQCVSAKMRFRAVLPAGYHHSFERYTTIYLLHGFGGDHTDWTQRTSLVKYAHDYNFIFITPDAHNSWYANSPDKKRNYENYILYELIPYVEKKYRAITTRHGRVIAGLSMGGYGAMKFALKFPGTFYYAGSISGSMYAPVGSRPDNKDISESLKAAFGERRTEQWTSNDPFCLLDSIKVVSTLPYLYIATGKDDNLFRIVERNHALVDRLRSRGVLYEFHEAPGGHTWQYWDMELREFLRRVSMYDALSQ